MKQIIPTAVDEPDIVADLLAVAEMVDEMYDAESYINGTQFEQELCDKARAAIAKATGKD